MLCRGVVGEAVIEEISPKEEVVLFKTQVACTMQNLAAIQINMCEVRKVFSYCWTRYYSNKACIHTSLPISKKSGGISQQYGVERLSTLSMPTLDVISALVSLCLFCSASNKLAWSTQYSCSAGKERKMEFSAGGMRKASLYVQPLIRNTWVNKALVFLLPC